MRPVVVLAAGSRDWSYDFTAQALVRHLGDRFDLRIAYEDTDVESQIAGADLIVDFWWKGTLERRHGRRVLKQVSSHRWSQRRYGQLLPRTLAKKHLAGSGGALVPSERLLAIVRAGIAEHAVMYTAPEVAVSLAPKGFEPALMRDMGRRGKGLVVGWAGNGKSPDKRLNIVRDAWPDLEIAGRGEGAQLLSYEQMSGWYNSIDVITCASDAEGDPRPLIEGMACGCFPVTVDVGIVPELVRHGENGLIVERTTEAFAAAFAWCRENLDQVREAGRRNAEEMLATRTWKQCAQAWGHAFDSALERKP